MLNNVHLMPRWLPTLDTRLDEYKEKGSHASFRVMLSSDPSETIPVAILERWAPKGSPTFWAASRVRASLLRIDESRARSRERDDPREGIHEMRAPNVRLTPSSRIRGTLICECSACGAIVHRWKIYGHWITPLTCPMIGFISCRQNGSCVAVNRSRHTEQMVPLFGRINFSCQLPLSTPVSTTPANMPMIALHTSARLLSMGINGGKSWIN